MWTIVYKIKYKILEMVTEQFKIYNIFYKRIMNR